MLELFGLRSHFGLVSGGEVGVHKWQQIAALREQGEVPRDAVMIGDRAVDLLAAHRNGLQSGAVMWGYGSRGAGRVPRGEVAPSFEPVGVERNVVERGEIGAAVLAYP